MAYPIIRNSQFFVVAAFCYKISLSVCASLCVAGTAQIITFIALDYFDRYRPATSQNIRYHATILRRDYPNFILALSIMVIAISIIFFYASLLLGAFLGCHSAARNDVDYYNAQLALPAPQTHLATIHYI